MSKFFAVMVVTILMSLAGCATSATATYAPATVTAAQEGERQLIPGVKREGDRLVSVGCVPASFGISLARTGGAARARAAAVRSVCRSGQAIVSGSEFNDSAFVGDAFCVEVVVPIAGITCS